MRHNLTAMLIKVSDYIRGLVNILYVETPRYSLVLQKIVLCYPNNLMKSEITYTPLGCYRPQRKLVSELNNKDVCVRFQPQHARMIVGIHTLECCLNLSQKEHARIYLDFIDSCMRLLNDEK